jgi:hypothetical protein
VCLVVRRRASLVAKGTDYSEVVVDHNTGKVAKSEAITTGDDLTAAKAQAEAMGGRRLHSRRRSGRR